MMLFVMIILLLIVSKDQTFIEKLNSGFTLLTKVIMSFLNYLYHWGNTNDTNIACCVVFVDYKISNSLKKQVALSHWSGSFCFPDQKRIQKEEDKEEDMKEKIFFVMNMFRFGSSENWINSEYCCSNVCIWSFGLLVFEEGFVLRKLMK